MAIKPGTLADFSGSMAEAIETELNKLMDDASLPRLAASEPERSDHRRLLIAIARGVVSHLKDNQASIVVPYHADGSNHTTTASLTVVGI